VGTLVNADLQKIGVNEPLKQLPVDTYFTRATPGYLSDQRKLYTTYWYNLAPALGFFYEERQRPDTPWTVQRDWLGTPPWAERADQ
jgi:hypothetical protein